MIQDFDLRLKGFLFLCGLSSFLSIIEHKSYKNIHAKEIRSSRCAY